MLGGRQSADKQSADRPAYIMRRVTSHGEMKAVAGTTAPVQPNAKAARRNIDGAPALGRAVSRAARRRGSTSS
jgi:hypothetical protein